MKTYNIKINAAADANMMNLALFLRKVMVYIFHIEDDTVIVDRILPSKLITK